MRAAVVVLGDLGRSPRMQYHALALAVNDAAVDVVALEGTDPVDALVAHPRIARHRLPSDRFTGRHRLPRPLFLAVAALRIVAQACGLARRLLVSVPRPDVILVQTPPAWPSLPVAWLCARLRGARLVVDWHNLTFAMVALRLGPRHLAVRLLAWLERLVARRADGHLCVSRAMGSFLRDRWQLGSIVLLYDRPHSRFRERPRPEAAAILVERVKRLAGLSAADRPVLVVSPTSWTIDEDFDLLLEAVDCCEARLVEASGRDPPAPPLLIVVTGLGPRRATFEARLAARRPRRVFVCTTWLAPSEYPVLLHAADLGLCLHRSASGLDLPMKVADMLGAGLPVCALDYGPCLREAIEDGVNGLLFADARDLADLLCALVDDGPGSARLARLRAAVVALPPATWLNAWNVSARALLLRSGRSEAPPA